MTFDHQNVIVGCITTILLTCVILIAAVTANSKADDKRIVQLKTEQTRIQACNSIEDETLRTLCINK